MDNRNDPGYMLAWLEQTLLSLEKEKKGAYLIGHIPPRECLHQFGVRFHALMERF